MKSQFQCGLIVAAFMSASFGISNSVYAASACKGLEVSSCQASESCAWVNSYTRKDGREVKAFCRAKSKRASKPVSGSPEKQSAKEVATQTD